MNSPPTSRPHLTGVLRSPAVDPWLVCDQPMCQAMELFLPRNPGMK